VPDQGREYLPRPVKVVAGINHPVDLRAIRGPFFDLVEVVLVRLKRVVSFFVGPVIGHCGDYREAGGTASGGLRFAFAVAHDTSHPWCDDSYLNYLINKGIVGGNSMSKKAAEHHKKASEHHTHAARHHGEAAKHHESGHHEKAAHHAHTARAHGLHARNHSEEAAKAHAEEHGKK
jgi:hypothetical protein